MSTYKEIWTTLSAVDVSRHVQKKNGLSFLSWAWAWGTLMEYYPASNYEFKEPVVYPDGSVEIWVTVEVVTDTSAHRRQMWLPVMDYKNKSIINPTSRDISDTRMRCLTKCLAMFGLGHYIYAGEDIPQAKKQEQEKAEEQARQKDIEAARNTLEGCQSLDDMRETFKKFNPWLREELKDYAKELADKLKEAA